MKRSKLAALSVNLAGQHVLAAASARVGRPLHLPSKVSFEIIETCNLKCIHCNIWPQRASPGAMTQAEWLEQLRLMRRWVGPFTLSFRDGEPFIASSFIPLVTESARLGVFTTCSTNGTLIDDETAVRIAEAGLNSLSFSLDGYRPETHDLSRGVKGTHAKALEAVERMKRVGGPNLKLSTIIAGHNLSELPDLVRWAAETGLHGVLFQALRRYRGDENLWPDVAAARAAVDALRKLKSDGWPVLNNDGQLLAMARYFEDPEGGFPEETCGAYAHWNVKADGSVRTCIFKEPIGNVRSSTPEAIWASAAARGRFDEVLGCKKTCMLMNCHFRPSIAARAAELGRHLSLPR